MDRHEAIEILQNNRTAFEKLKKVYALAFIGFAVITVSAILGSFYYAQSQRNQIFILDDGHCYSAEQVDNFAQRDLEVETHITRFHELFFNLAPNMESVTTNVNKALGLVSDDSAFDYFNDFQEKMFYSRLVNNHAVQYVSVDSLAVNMKSRPYKAVAYCSRYYARETNLTKYYMVTTCDVLEAPRSKTNPNGLMICNFAIQEDRKLESKR